MSNVRPWFRLSSIARPTSQGSSDPPPPPQSQPQPRPTPRRPIISRPPPPRQQPPSPPSPPRQQPPSPPSPPRQQQSPLSPPRQRYPPTPRQLTQSPPSPPPQQKSPPRQQKSPPRQQKSPPRQQKSPPRQRYPPAPRQLQSPPSPPRQQKSPPRQRYPALVQLQSPPSLPRQQKSPPRQQQQRYQYINSPPSRNMSPPSPPPQQRRQQQPAYTPPLSPKEVQEALPRKQNSPESPTQSKHNRLENSPKQLSPYTLPPSQFPPQTHQTTTTHQKNILTSEKTNLPLPQHNPNTNHQNKKPQHQTSSSEFDNILGTKVITIAGENRGAVMEVVRSSPNKLAGSRRLNEERDIKNNNQNSNEMNSSTNPPMRAFMNSNVQMINNSIVYNSSAIHHDPGIHLRLSRKPGSANGFHVTDYGDNEDGYNS